MYCTSAVSPMVQKTKWTFISIHLKEYAPCDLCMYIRFKSCLEYWSHLGYRYISNKLPPAGKSQVLPTIGTSSITDFHLSELFPYLMLDEMLC